MLEKYLGENILDFLSLGSPLMNFLGGVLIYIYPLIWITSFSMIIYGVWDNRSKLWEVLTENRKYFYFLLLLIILLVSYRVYFGPTMHSYGDGFRSIYVGEKLLETGKYVTCHYTGDGTRYCHFPFKLGHNGMAFFEGIYLLFFEEPQSGWYLTMTFSTLSLVLIFILCKLWLNDNLAAISSVILTATFPLFFFFSLDLMKTIPSLFFVLLTLLGLELYRRYENTSSLLLFTGSAVFSTIIRLNLFLLIPYYSLSFLYIAGLKLKNIKKIIPFFLLSFLQPISINAGPKTSGIVNEFSTLEFTGNIVKFFNLFGLTNFFGQHIIPIPYLIFFAVGFFYLYKENKKISNLIVFGFLSIFIPLLIICTTCRPGIGYLPTLLGSQTRFFVPSFFAFFILSGSFISFVNKIGKSSDNHIDLYIKILVFIIISITVSLNLLIINNEMDPGKKYNSEKRIGAFKCINFLETQVENPRKCYILSNVYGPGLIESNSPFQGVGIHLLSESGLENILREKECVLYWKGLRNYYWDPEKISNKDPFLKFENIKIEKKEIVSKSYPGYNCTLYSVNQGKQ